MDIHDTILQKLGEVEQRQNVRILHAIESGSRAWGFASPDSDYDVRFVYVRPTEFYLRLDTTRDVIEWQLDSTLDINGWDLTKALKLLRKSNMTLFEWDASPIVYQTSDQWPQIRQVMQAYFRPKAAALHYLSTAHHTHRQYIVGRKEVRLKKYLYVLRPLLAAQWILDKNQPAPMLFANLVAAEADEVLKDELKNLTTQKMALPELGTGPRIKTIDTFIEAQLATLKTRITNLPKASPGDWATLNQLFRDIQAAI